MMQCQIKLSYLLFNVTFAILILVTAARLFVLDGIKWTVRETARACNRSSSSSGSSFDPDFQLAAQESLGFFDDIGSSNWVKLKEKVRAMSPNVDTWDLPRVDSEGKPRGDNLNRLPGHFYQRHYEPDFVCQYERRIGKRGDGGKWICDPHRIAKQKDCLVYSVGSMNDFSFEEAVLRDIGPHCEIHTFDFGNYAAGAEKLGTRLHDGVNKTAVVYHQVGLGLDDPPKFKSLKTIVEKLGHVNRTIDIFKIDCEGEFARLFVCAILNSLAVWRYCSDVYGLALQMNTCCITSSHQISMLLSRCLGLFWHSWCNINSLKDVSGRLLRIGLRRQSSCDKFKWNFTSQIFRRLSNFSTSCMSRTT